MKLVNLRVFFSAALLVMAIASPHDARATPVTLSAGESAVFNYEYGGVVPVGGFISVAFFSGVGVQVQGLTEVFGGLNALDLVFDTLGSQIPPGIASTDPRVTDAIFSVRYTAGATITLDPYANLIPQDTSVLAIRVDGVQGGGSVPEPATLALAVLGLLLATVRRPVSSPL